METQWGLPKFQLKNVTEKEVLEIITKIKSSHAYGRDKIDGFTVKMAGQILAPVLVHVINLSLWTGQFPQKWKLA